MPPLMAGAETGGAHRGERMKNVPWRYPFLGKLLPMKLANNFMVFSREVERCEGSFLGE